MMEADYLIIGSGLTGGMVARTLADSGKSVLVVDRREHVGGNVHDSLDPNGIRVHTYGPHYFRTNDQKLWDFVHRFAPFRPFEAILKSFVDGRYENWPIAASYIRRAVGESWHPEFAGEPRNFEDASLAMMPRLVYEKFVRGYSEKQWGVSARSLSAGLAKRFDVREDDEPRLMRHRFQGLPEHGYAQFTEALVRDIPVILNCDYLRSRNEFSGREMVIFTGPIDEYFDFDLGRLKYRGQQREHQYLPTVEWAQPCVQVNNPDPGNGPHIRTLEWKHLMPAADAARISGTLLTRETTVTPSDPDHYEYPFPDDANARLYRRYRDRAAASSGLLVCGRLGEYRYYDMDQAIARALILANRILSHQQTADPDA